MLEKWPEASFIKLKSWRDVFINQKISKTSIAKAAPLLRIWGSATIVSFFIIMAIYIQFFGRFKLVWNETIYENHYRVNQAGTVELFTWEGYGVTSYGSVD